MVVVAVVSVCTGAVPISLAELWSMVRHKLGWSQAMRFNPQQEAILFTLRLPRVLLGVLIGAGLAVSGAAMQGLFRNPLAEPGLIGISSGASLFAVMMIVLEAKVFTLLTGVLGYYALSVVAFAGACTAAFSVYHLAMHQGKTVVTTLLLVGIAINALAGAFNGLLTFGATDEQLRNITFWSLSLGSLGGASWKTVLGVLPFILIPVAVLPFLAKPLNAFALGEGQASHMGTDVNRTKKIIIVLATMAVGTSVAVAGIIGFVGLIVPHILRMAFTADHRLIIPASALLGATMLTFSDLVSRTLVAPAELPIGVITALMGTPIFLYIILNERKKHFR
nr:iron ABC transporter permease [Sabulibacter ruber]